MTNVQFPGWLGIGLLAFLLATIGVAITYIALRYRLERKETDYRLDEMKRERDAFDSAVERLRERMALPSLIELNRIMLEQYHGIATDQAGRSYRSSQRAMWLGFSALVVAFFSSLAVPEANFRIAAAALGVAGSALAAFLSQTYLRVYERSLEQLNRYFNQPLLNSYYLTAERLAGGLSESPRDELLREIVQQLLRETTYVTGDRANRRPVSPRRSAKSSDGSPTAPQDDID